MSKVDPYEQPVELPEPNPEADSTSIAWKMYNQECEDHARTIELRKKFERQCKDLELKIEREKKDMLTRIREAEERIDNIIKTMNTQIMPTIRRNGIVR